MSLQEMIHEALTRRGKTLALAESCSGGCLAAKFTAISGASKYFIGSLVTYSSFLKEKLLGVASQTLAQHGAVSHETATEMLLGLLKVTEADYGVSITGIAGLSVEGKQVGTVFIAIGEKGKKSQTVCCQFDGGRSAIVEKACRRALEELWALIG